MTIIFLHGVPDTPALWRGVIDALGDVGRQILTPNLPGFGAPAPDGFSATKDAYAEWFIGEIERTGTPVDLVGHDWGALLVLRTACLKPHLVRSWTVANAVIEPGYRGHRMARLWATPLIGEFVMSQARNAKRMEKGLASAGMPAALAAKEAPQIDLAMRRSILSLYRSANGLNFAGPWVDDLATLPAGGLVYWGDKDPFVDLSFAVGFCDRRGDRLEIEKGCGHWACAERPEKFAAALRSHWASNR